MAGILLLGPVLFRDFELPASIAWGGRQRLAVHQLPGGRRVIDAMGRDDAAIIWSGTFSGADAAERARLLDLMRAEGAAWPLTWGRFLYSVVIQDFAVSYERANWMQYRIACAVLRDEIEGLVEDALSLAQSAAADLDAGSAFGLDDGGSRDLLATPGAGTLGTDAHGLALAGLGGLSAGADARFAAADSAASTADFAGIADAAGELANAAFARGYAARAFSALASASS